MRLEQALDFEGKNVSRDKIWTDDLAIPSCCDVAVLPHVDMIFNFRFHFPNFQ